jgi:5,10-methylenetetrahydrofolate reductase
MFSGSHPDPGAPSGALDRLRDDEPLIAVELRPPRVRIGRSATMDVWIDMHHAMGRLSRRDTIVFLTDSAVGEPDEENLHHLSANLPEDVDRGRIVPFLTCKHSLDYCHLFARRASDMGFEAVTVLGGDNAVGPPRCVPHAAQLRASLREVVPGLRLGGWVNPHRNREMQLRLLQAPEFESDFFLTQIVSHHELAGVEDLLRGMEVAGIEVPGVFGVFFYHSAHPGTLTRLARFFPVPAEELTREFDSGGTPVEICARTIRALRALGVNRVYVSNFGLSRVDRVYDALLGAVND